MSSQWKKGRGSVCSRGPAFNARQRSWRAVMQAQENWTLILMVFAGAPVVLLQILNRSIFYGLQSLHTHSQTLSLSSLPLDAPSQHALLTTHTLGAHSRCNLLMHGPSRRILSAHDALGVIIISLSLPPPSHA